MIKKCNQNNKKALNPLYECNTKTGRWKLIPVSTTHNQCPGDVKEKKFLHHLQERLIGNVLDDQEKDILYDLNVIEKSDTRKKITITTIYSGLLKKSDVIIKFNTGHILGISYKQTKARTIQSWTSIPTLELIFGSSNVRKISRYITYQINTDYIYEQPHNYEKLFLGATFHVSNNKTKSNIKLNKVIRLSNKIVRQLYFGHENDRSNCRLIFQSEDYNVHSLMDIVSHSGCKTIKDIKFLKTNLYLDIRFPFINKSASNNTCQLLSIWCPDTLDSLDSTPIRLKTRSKCEKHGTFIPYYKWLHNSKNYKTTNSNNLIKTFFHSDNIVFPRLHTTKKYYTKYILNNWKKITGQM